ncbi:hypothetical protein INR49_002022, partial [Caranx melampygus]
MKRCLLIQRLQKHCAGVELQARTPSARVPVAQQVETKHGALPDKSNDQEVIYDEVKTEQACDAQPILQDNEKKALQYTQLHLAAAGLGIVCVVLVSVVIALSIHLKTVMSEHSRENMTLTAQNLLLTKEKAELERDTQELTRERDQLNWTIGVILKYDSFPVNTRCPQKEADGEQAAHSRRFGLLAGCLGLLCVLLVACISAIIYISIKMNKEETNYKANLNSLTSDNHQLVMEKSLLEQESEELSRDRDDLNWTLSVILKFNNFPVNEFCPDKKCQPCQKGWIQFQDKCYLFYNRSPWMTWQRSQNQCKSVAADLVVIDSQQEQEFIKKHIKSYYDRFHGYWIGLKQNDNQDWIWVDGHNDTLGLHLQTGRGLVEDMIPPVEGELLSFLMANLQTRDIEAFIHMALIEFHICLPVCTSHSPCTVRLHHPAGSK